MAVDDSCIIQINIQSEAEFVTSFGNLSKRNVIYPLAILNETWIGFYSNYFDSWNPAWKSLLLGIACTRLLRQSFRTSHYQWLVLLGAHLLKYDLQRLNFQEPVILTWFIGNFVYIKILGCYQRLGFVYVQLNPGTTWGSAFHAVAQDRFRIDGRPDDSLIMSHTL